MQMLLKTAPRSIDGHVFGDCLRHYAGNAEKKPNQHCNPCVACCCCTQGNKLIYQQTRIFVEDSISKFNILNLPPCREFFDFLTLFPRLKSKCSILTLFSTIEVKILNIIQKILRKQNINNIKHHFQIIEHVQYYIFRTITVMNICYCQLFNPERKLTPSYRKQ